MTDISILLQQIFSNGITLLSQHDVPPLRSYKYFSLYCLAICVAIPTRITSSTLSAVQNTTAIVRLGVCILQHPDHSQQGQQEPHTY